MTKSIIPAIALTLVISVQSASAQNFTFSWKKVTADASRTGVTPSNATNTKEAMGYFEGNKYYAPSGRVYKAKSSTAKAAKAVIDAQDVMAPLKLVIAHSAKEMVRHSPESEVTDWAVDFLMKAAEEVTAKHIDFGIMNFGGIRVDMPKGDVFEDDIKSMFPFKNAICYVGLKGSRVKEIFEQMAARNVQVIGGARIVVQDRKLVSLEIGGKPVEDDKIYGLATIDFLLEGGDGLQLGKDAVELIRSEYYMTDILIPYLKEQEAKGQMIDYNTDGRVTILPSTKPEEGRR